MSDRWVAEVEADRAADWCAAARHQLGAAFGRQRVVVAEQEIDRSRRSLLRRLMRRPVMTEAEALASIDDVFEGRATENRVLGLAFDNEWCRLDRLHSRVGRVDELHAIATHAAGGRMRLNLEDLRLLGVTHW